MNDQVASILFGMIFLVGIMILATMTAVVGLMDRVKELEDKATEQDQEPIRTMIAESQELQARLIAQEMERMTSADE